MSKLTAVVLAFVLSLAVAGLAYVFQAVAGESEHWKIVVPIESADGANRGKLIYGAPATGPVYFDSEAACKKALTDPKDPFAKVWGTVKKKAKEFDIVTGTPICVMDLDIPKPKADTI